MFDKKQQNLFPKTPVIVESGKGGILNSFEQGAKFSQKSNETKSENGSVKYKTTGSNLVDQFAKNGGYIKPRSYNEVSKDMELLWNEDPNTSLRFTFYLRGISGDRKGHDGKSITEKAVMGQGLKTESIMRMMWLAVNHEEIFAKNIKLFIAIGSWKDIFQMLRIDLTSNGWDKKILNWTLFQSLILEGLNDSNQTNLVKKYLPSIVSKTKCTTLQKQANHLIGAWLSNCIFGEKDNITYYKQYRLLKSSGTAHQWQQLISRKSYNLIKFDSIHGKALRILVKSKFLTKTGLSTKYAEWIGSAKNVKSTDFLFELFKGIDRTTDSNILKTVDSQFLTTVNKVGKDEVVERSLIPVLDSSGSMDSEVTNGVKAWDVARSMGLYCSYKLKSKFNMSYFEFSHSTEFKQWKGNTPTQQYKNANSSRIVASTNFESVFDKLIQIKNTGVDESDFPTGMVCFSDGCFNSAYGRSNHSSIVTTGINKMRKVFSKEFCDNFIVILWDINRGQKKVYEGSANQKGLIQISGYDPSILNLILRGVNITNSDDMITEALNQPYLDLIQL